jgi:hypothetical protein
VNKKNILSLVAFFFVVALLSLVSVFHTIGERTRLNESLDKKWQDVLVVEKHLSGKSLLDGEVETKINGLKKKIVSCKKERVLYVKEECFNEVTEKERELEIKVVVALNENHREAGAENE